jgi:hypothetical protein
MIFKILDERAIVKYDNDDMSDREINWSSNHAKTCEALWFKRSSVNDFIRASQKNDDFIMLSSNCARTKSLTIAFRNDICR